MTKSPKYCLPSGHRPETIHKINAAKRSDGHQDGARIMMYNRAVPVGLCQAWTEAVR